MKRMKSRKADGGLFRVHSGPSRVSNKRAHVGHAQVSHGLSRVLRGALALFAALAVLSPAVPAARAEGEIRIASAEDLRQLAENCALDAWSRGKTVLLTDDITLEGEEFSPIPTFSGEFQGNGHLITGLRLTADGTAVGLFRYIEEGGVVRDLRVSGTVHGIGEGVGGIVGRNRGAVRECSFSGAVQGSAASGGIAGWNEGSGEITGCVVSGSVRGSDGTGGIAGKNSGQILSCQNQAAVNVTLQETRNAMEGLLGRDVLEQLLNGGWKQDAETVVSQDTGGVAGWSGGVIQSSTNLGDVGYPHVGYNVGGIAGRQSGYLDGCVNSGAVRGRKDVGGVAGQAEPDVTLTMGRDALAELESELETLNGLIQRAVEAGGSGRSALLGQLSALGSSADAARESARLLADQVADISESTARQVQGTVSDLSGAMEDMEAAMGRLTAAASSLESMSTNVDTALKSLADAVELSGDARATLEQGTAELREGANAFSGAADALSQGRQDLSNAVTVRDRAAARAALAQMESAITSLTEAGDKIRSSIQAIRTAFDGLPQLAAAVEALGRIPEAQRQQFTALQSLRDALAAARQNLWVDGTSLEDAMEALTPAGSGLTGAASSVADALDSLNRAVQSLDRPTDALADALDALESATGSGVGRELQSAFQSLGSAARRLQTIEPVQYTPVGQNAQAAGNRLYSALSSLSDGLWSTLRTADASGESLSASLSAVSAQLSRVLDTASGTAEDIQNGAYREVVRDTSEEDVAGTRMGKLSGSRNTGTVEGDRNVGGIAGAVAIEYELDPESDLTEGFRFGSTFETRAVVQVCRNLGTVQAKKSCAGGIAGAADLGAVLSCENYGAVRSEDGGYVGGIAGRSRGVLRRSWSKCVLSGQDHVGGIAGEASTLTDCRAIATIEECGEYGGAVAGEITDGGTASGNWFLNTGTAGIDGVSRSGAAEPISYEALQNDPATPLDFLSFAIHLTADGQTVAEIPFSYGQDLLTVPLPPVPEKEGYSGTWPAFDTTGRVSDIHLEARYEPWITLLGSEEKDKDRSLALAEGRFTAAAVLHAEAVNASPPPGGEQPMLVTLENGGEEGAALRLLCRAGKNGGTVYQQTNGRWVKRSTRSNGQYLIVHLDGAAGIFSVVGAAGFPWRLAVFAGGTGVTVIVVLCLGAALFHRRRKDKEAEGA